MRRVTQEELRGVEKKMRQSYVRIPRYHETTVHHDHQLYPAKPAKEETARRMKKLYGHDKPGVCK